MAIKNQLTLQPRQVACAIQARGSMNEKKTEMEMVEDAEQLLRETLDSGTAFLTVLHSLDGIEYKKLCKLENPKKAIREVAYKLAKAIADELRE